MYQEFHPLSRYWIARVIWFLFLASLIVYFAVERVFICAFWPVVFLGLSLMDMHLLKHTSLIMDEQNFLFQRGKSNVQVLWKDVLMVRQTNYTWKQVNLELATQEELFTVPLGYFNVGQVWHWVKYYAPADALREDAYKRLPAYQEWLLKSQELINNTHQALCVGFSLRTKMMIGFAFVLLGGIGSLLWLTLNSIAVILCLGPIILVLGGWAVSSIFYRVEMTSEGVTVIDLWKKRQIRWDEVEYIEHDFGQRRFVFYGPNKRLAIMGLQLLIGKDQIEMVYMLQAQVEYRKIELRHKERALFTWSRNVKI